MSISPIHLTAHEYTITFQFMGADIGKWPAVEPTNDIVTLKGNTCRFEQGVEFAQFTTNQDLVELNRIIKQNPSLDFGTIFAVPSEFLEEFRTNGPLVKVVVTANNQLDGGVNLTLTHKGIMRLGAMDFLGNPGTIECQVLSYGVTPTITQSGL